MPFGLDGLDRAADLPRDVGASDRSSSATAAPRTNWLYLLAYVYGGGREMDKPRESAGEPSLVWEGGRYLGGKSENGRQ